MRYLLLRRRHCRCRLIVRIKDPQQAYRCHGHWERDSLPIPSFEHHSREVREPGSLGQAARHDALFPEGGDALVVCLAMTGAAVDVTLASAERRLRVSGSHCVLSKVKLGR